MHSPQEFQYTRAARVFVSETRPLTIPFVPLAPLLVQTWTMRAWMAGFAFGEVEGDGMAIVMQIFNVGGDNQGSIQSQGNAYIDKNFPKISRSSAQR